MNTNNLIKIIITIFLILNISIFVLGFSLINNKIKLNKEDHDKKITQYIKKEEELLEKLNILSNSKNNINLNLIEMKSNIDLIKNKLNESINNFNSIDNEKKYLEKSIKIEKEKSKLLLKKKLLLREQLNNNLKVKTQKIIRRTRAS